MTESNNPDYMSQFKGSILAEALGQHVSSRHEFYREYVTQDHGHVHLTIISEEVALFLIERSPYRPFLTDYMVCRPDDGEPIKGIMNKGAVRLTPRDWDSKGPSVLTGDQVSGRYAPDEKRLNFCDPRMELWVYRHDDNYWLTTPSKVCYKDHRDK